MKIGIYTDVHCCYNSSILPLHLDNSIYTTRLNMIINTFKWMYEVFKENGVDIIVNCGDLFHSHQVRSEELSAMSKALSYSSGIPEIHVLGNHEILDKNRQFYATALLSNYPNIQIIDSPTKLDNGLSFLPYIQDENEVNEVLPLISNKILFSHIDIKGSVVSVGHELETGASPIRLQTLFDCVINGHIHTPQKWSGNVYNIGSATSLSFSDNSDYHPHIAILDSDTLNISYFNNPFAIRFIKDIRIESVEDVKKLESNYSTAIALRATASSEMRSILSDMLDKNNNIVAYRIQYDSIDSPISEEAESSIVINTDICSQYQKFLEQSEDLRYPVNSYIKVMQESFQGAGELV